MNNKKLGTVFEREVCRLFANRGYWVHFITPDSRGAQPFDIIAVKNQMAIAVECKTLADSRNYFPKSRLEDNQILAFNKWIQCGNCYPIIAILWKSHIYFVSYKELCDQDKIDMRKL